MIIRQRKSKAVARLNPLECQLCHHTECEYHSLIDEMYRLGLSIRFEDCALYNGGKVLKAVQND